METGLELRPVWFLTCAFSHCEYIQKTIWFAVGGKAFRGLLFPFKPSSTLGSRAVHTQCRKYSSSLRLEQSLRGWYSAENQLYCSDGSDQQALLSAIQYSRLQGHKKWTRQSFTSRTQWRSRFHQQMSIKQSRSSTPENCQGSLQAESEEGASGMMSGGRSLSVTQSSWFAQAFPSFSPESPTLREMSQSWATCNG